jgi:hypothetical protein
MPKQTIQLGSACTPGLIGGKPVLGAGCDGGIWQCRAEGGRCFICNSVAIRLAKKLDTMLVTRLLETNANISLVSYGTSINSTVNLTNFRSDLLNNISAYHSDQNETCISCAINKSLEILNKSTATKKYLVLMSDGEANKCIDDDCGVSLDPVQQAIDEAKKASGITIYAVGFGKMTGSGTLKEIVKSGKQTPEDEKSRYFEGRNEKELEDAYAIISKLIGNAYTSRQNKVYGSQAMVLSAAKTPPIAVSDPFDIYERGKNYDLWLYSNLTLSWGRFNITIYFYDGKGSRIYEKGTLVHSYAPVSSTGFILENFTVIIPDTAFRAQIEFRFGEADAAKDNIYIDDVYFGPPISCKKEGEGWRCGDLLIIRTSREGEMFPYFSNSSIDPTKSVMFKDANCKESCSYKIVSPSNVLNKDVVC